jgi:hypothetical protein
VRLDRRHDGVQDLKVACLDGGGDVLLGGQGVVPEKEREKHRREGEGEGG